MLSVEQIKEMKLRKGNILNILYDRRTREENAIWVKVELIKVTYKKVLRPELWQAAKNQYGKLNYIPQAQNENDYINIFELKVKEESGFIYCYQIDEVFAIEKL